MGDIIVDVGTCTTVCLGVVVNAVHHLLASAQTASKNRFKRDSLCVAIKNIKLDTT